MPYAPADAHVRFTLHPDHHPSVIATTTGPTADAARTHLHNAGFRSTGPDTMVLARIDREEPFYADRTAGLLKSHGFTVEIAPDLQEEIYTKRARTSPWWTSEGINSISAAQLIHDDIVEGRLIIHAHAHNGHTTVAVGSYTTGIRRHVHLHGEDHLRQITHRRDTEAEAVADFHELYSVAVRPGPAPLTDLERAVRRILGQQPGRQEETSTTPTEPPAAGSGEHEEFLDAFLESASAWEKYRTWSDETTIASHESLTVRAVFDHEARHRTDTAWAIAEYDGPAGQRLWHATLTAGTPIPLIHAILQHLDTPPPTSTSDPYEALRDAGWHPASHPARTTWQAPDRTLTFEHVPHAQDDRWTLYGGDDLNRPAWAIRLSAAAPDDLLAQLTAEAADLAPARPRAPAPAAPRSSSSPALPPPPRVQLPRHR
ncbi:DUF317 domain-containing protein [Streptomyces cinereoruber]|uniref:DUF317 domain-containing protein n=1 Tax=Streptomyces cinereoruber TaxID=67260 RepID=UPI00367ABE18